MLPTGQRYAPPLLTQKSPCGPKLPSARCSEDTPTSLQISLKIGDKKPNQIALLSTEAGPIHCVITSQTKYFEPLSLVFNYPSIATKIPWSMIIVTISTLSVRLINNSSVFTCFLQILFVTPTHVQKFGSIAENGCYHLL